MPKYDVPMGDPIDLLMEEAAEIIQAVGKYRRFGPQGTQQWIDEHPGARFPPHRQIITEVGDLLAILNILIANGWTTWRALEYARIAKLRKLEEYFGFTLPNPMFGKSPLVDHSLTFEEGPDTNPDHYVIHGTWQPDAEAIHGRIDMWRHRELWYIVYADSPQARAKDLPIAPWTKE